MDSAPDIERFIHDFFHERTKALKLRLEIHRVYWRRYYRDECRWDGRRGVVEKSESEKIVEVLKSDTGINVVTTGNTICRSRYRVKSSGNGWLIQEVDMECMHCHAIGSSTNCKLCGGAGWLERNDREKLMSQLRGEQPSTQISGSAPEERTEGNPVRDPAIEKFMAELFRERTETWKKEAEIHAKHVKQFYSPECDLARWVPSAASSKDEKILSIEPAKHGVNVITNGIHNKRLRYQLRPTDQSWVIWEVDPECLYCLKKGWSADCIWCGGTVWERKKRRSIILRNRPPGGEEPPPETPRWQP